MSKSAQEQEKINRLQKAIGEDYTVLNRIGGGGMGEVYLASHKTLGGKWAIKLLADNLADDPELVNRFINEARIEAQLQHPNIVKVVNIGQRDNFHFLIMSFVEGEDLDKMMRRVGQMGTEEVVNVGLQVVRALECAHDNGIVHRDLKPQNIRIDQRGNLVVMDFGIARLRDNNSRVKTQLGQQLGTAAYMSPEQVHGREIDGRSDLYSLGVILYHLCAGANPFESETHWATAANQLTVIPHPLSEVREGVPEELSEIVQKLLEKDPAERFQSASEVREALAVLSTGADVFSTPRPSTAAPVAEHLRKLGSLDDVLCPIPEPELPRALTSAEAKVMAVSDGSKSIRDILKACGLAEEEAATAISELEKLGAVYREIRFVTVVPTQQPQKTTRRDRVAPTRKGTGTTPAPTVTPAPAPAPEAKRKLPMWAMAVIGLVVVAFVITIAVSFMTPAKQEQSTVKVDAAPFATVTITGEDGKPIHAGDTPLTVPLLPGSYTFEFKADGRQTQTITQKVGTGLPDTVFVNFWNADATRKLVEGYTQ